MVVHHSRYVSIFLTIFLFLASCQIPPANTPLKVTSPLPVVNSQNKDFSVKAGPPILFRSSFSPNGDGKEDTLTVTIDVPGSWTFTISNSSLITVKTFTGTGPQVLTWDATDDNLVVLPDGLYSTRFIAQPNVANLGNFTIIDRANPGITKVSLDELPIGGLPSMRVIVRSADQVVNGGISGFVQATLVFDDPVYEAKTQFGNGFASGTSSFNLGHLLLNHGFSIPVISHKLQLLKRPF